MAVNRVYFDNAATTAIDPRVAKAMASTLESAFGNPSSLHREGRQAHEAVEQARLEVATLLGATTGEILFTGSGTEATNLALRGAMARWAGEPSHAITTAIEHPATLEVYRQLEQAGVRVTYLPVDGEGFLDPQDLRKAIQCNTRLVSIMAANNVVGTLQPIAECSRITRECGILLHVDAVQAVGKIPFDLGSPGIDLLSLSAHKIHGPKGVGALFAREGVALQPITHGGGQERGLRSGTENVAGIAGLGMAAQLVRQEMSRHSARMVQLRERLIEGVQAAIPEAYLIGHRFLRLPGLACFGFQGLEGEAMKMLLALDDAGFAVSSGSACSAHNTGQPSHVLSAMGFDPIRARGSLRVSLGRFNDQEQVRAFVEALSRVVRRLTPIAGGL